MLGKLGIEANATPRGFGRHVPRMRHESGTAMGIWKGSKVNRFRNTGGVFVALGLAISIFRPSLASERQDSETDQDDKVRWERVRKWAKKKKRKKKKKKKLPTCRLPGIFFGLNHNDPEGVWERADQREGRAPTKQALN